VTTWILLRGLTREARHWGSFQNLVQAAWPDDRIALIDLPGCGTQTAQISPISMAAIADHCRREAKRLDLPPPYHLLALSLGAMAAIAWATAYPEEIAGCVLINTSLRGLSPLHHRLRPGAFLPLIKLVLAGSAHRRENIILRLTSSTPESSPDTAEDWAAIRGDRPVSALNTLRQLAAAISYRPPTDPPCERILILGSAGDALVNPDCSRRLSATWNTRYAEHPTAGHDLTLDDGPWVVEQIQRWTNTAVTKQSRSAATFDIYLSP
jgi:pimeloyl-ACP methyl ester carboxylesterase